MAAGTLARRWALAVATPLVVLGVGAGLAMAGAPAPSASGSTLAQGCYQPPDTPGLYNPPNYSSCGQVANMPGQGWPKPTPKPSAPK